MPTFEATARFWNEYRQLRLEQQSRFRGARQQFVNALFEWEEAGCPGMPSFPGRLGMKRMVGHGSVFEMAWAPNGRCTWEYGRMRRPGRCHVIWRRIGSHAIYSDP